MALLLRRLSRLFSNTTGLNISRRGKSWELIEIEVLSRFLSAFRVDCVFDIGANAGQYATRLREVGFRGLIISFEPNPTSFATLRALAETDERWVVKQTALDCEPRALTFNIMKSDQFSSLHEPDHSTTNRFLDMNVIEQQVAISTETLDSLFPTLQAEFLFLRPFLKMDTQGHDLDVVAGAAQCLARFVGLQSELSVTPLYKGVSDFSEALAIYAGLGFKLTALVPNNAGHFPDLHEIDCVMYNPRFQSSETDH